MDIFVRAYLTNHKAYEEEDKYYRGFGTSPVLNTYWKISDGIDPPSERLEYEEINMFDKPEIYQVSSDTFNKKLLSNPKPKLFSSASPTMVFRRYNNLLAPTENLSLFTRMFLGKKDTLGVKFAMNQAVLDDSWKINLVDSPEDYKPRGVIETVRSLQYEYNKRKGMQMQISDMTNELNDLLKVYDDAEKHLREKKESLLTSHESAMKRYLEAKEEHLRVLTKLNTLRDKLAPKACEDCDEDEDDYEDDE